MEFKGIEQFDYLEKGIFSFIPKQAYRIKKTELWMVFRKEVALKIVIS
jgi:hypothetical protein